MPENGDETRWFREIDAANLTPGYTVLVYETWVGDRNDPATQILEYMSVFNEEDMPDEYSTARDQSNVPPYVQENKRYRYMTHHFDGLKGSVADQQLRVIQEADSEVQRFKNEQKNLLPNPNGDEDDYYSRRHRQGYLGIQYEDFLEAIEKVAGDDNDEESWTIIDTWRQRSLRSEERV